jgi:hypothetical protein
MEEGVDNGKLSWTHGSRKGPETLCSLRHISEARDLSVSLNAKVLGEIQIGLVFVVDGVSWHSGWIDEREGLDRKRLLERQFAGIFWDSVSMKG